MYNLLNEGFISAILFVCAIAIGQNIK